MTNFTKKSFSVAVGSDAYRENFDAAFGKKREPVAGRCFYFGCWGQAGHYLHYEGGQSVRFDQADLIVHCDNGDHIDSSLAPRKNSYGELGFGRAFDRWSEECPEGLFFLHHLKNGFTAIQWWDRNQGDSRGACNSTILLEGVHDADTMLAALEQRFPKVLANLKRAGIELVEVKLP